MIQRFGRTAIALAAAASGALAWGADTWHADRPPASQPAPPYVSVATATSPDAATSPVRVKIDNFTFNPATITVPAGTEVLWTNGDDVPHTVTSSAKPRAFASPALDTDEQFSHVFATPGIYDYFCAVHPHMTGRVIVR
jgi:plastocyanin